MNENYDKDLSMPPLHHFLSESDRLLLFGHESKGKNFILKILT